MGRIAEVEEKHKDRIKFLADHPELWEHLPFPPNPAGRGKGDIKEYSIWFNWKKDYNKPIVDIMKKEGLLNPTTSYKDINIPAMLHEVKELV